jgi:hypothetical protein
MLTDIFAYRYENVPIWTVFEERERRLLLQGFRIFAEQLFPYQIHGYKWRAIHDKLTMELGLSELSPRYYSHQTTWNGKSCTRSGEWPLDYICKAFVCGEYNESFSPDIFMKERISFIELAFREKERDVKAANAKLPQLIMVEQVVDDSSPRRGRIRPPGNSVDGLKAANDSKNKTFVASVKELNERFRRAGCGLHYHSGFIQISGDRIVQKYLEEPFWACISGPEWKNVDHDIKEAIDRRDTGGKDGAFYAARALESTIKIISDSKGWTHGREKGAHGYIDNLCSKQRGDLIEVWEKELLKSFFTSVRNPIGHGSGSGDMHELSFEQTNWAIESCMAWIKNLVLRL